MTGDSSTDTPLMRQWREVKARHPEALLLFRVGDFYEMFNQDAVDGARLLDLTLTSRNNGSSRAPLAGIPASGAEPYLRRLVALGQRVAICEQVENPAEAKGLVRREVTELLTPGALLGQGVLDDRRNNHLVALCGQPDGSAPLGMACADLSTGELRLRRVAPGRLAAALEQAEPAELLLPDRWRECHPEGAADALLTHRPEWLFDAVAGEEELCRRLGVHSLEGFGLEMGDEQLVGAWAALWAYLAEVQPAASAYLRPPRIEGSAGTMELDAMTRRNLELLEPLRAGAGAATLLATVDEALTPMGGRLLRRWLIAPSIERSVIDGRLDAVAELVGASGLRRAVRDALREVRDLERLAVRAAAGRATPRELLALGASLDQLPPLRDLLADSRSAELGTCRDGIAPPDALRERIRAAIDSAPPASLADGGVIRPGYDAELDELRAGRDGAIDWIAALQQRERERTGIGSLKVGFNRVFGYYLEVTRANLERVPAEYHRKQTLANAERFYTPELKEWEEKVLSAEERIAAREAELFGEIREAVGAEVHRIQRLAGHVAALDVFAGFAELATRRGYVRPRLHDDFALRITGGRHPVVETTMPPEAFIPNDVVLDERGRVMILTGPNMAGKSTLLRQVGLICLLAQVGCFVPASEALLPVVDRIFTRVGASDHLARGHSTFMVEMQETAAILHGATQRSLVLLDEIGRGTATWDGFSVATAVTEHLHDEIGAKTLFATHYHELTDLAERLSGVVNASVAIREANGEIVFLRRLVPGRANRSYGVEVARLAGLPHPVVERARAVLAEREQAAARQPRSAGAEVQIGLFPSEPHPVVARLRELDPDRTTPLQALVTLAELRSLADAG